LWLLIYPEKSIVLTTGFSESPFRPGEGMTEAAVQILIGNMLVVQFNEAFIFLAPVALSTKRVFG
jgi:hypothetical protein